MQKWCPAPARLQLLERERAERAQFERAIRGLFAAANVEPPAPVKDIALMIYMLDSYAPLQRALDPDMSEDFLFETLTVLFRAAVALAQSEAPKPSTAKTTRSRR